MTNELTTGALLSPETFQELGFEKHKEYWVRRASNRLVMLKEEKGQLIGGGVKGYFSFSHVNQLIHFYQATTGERLV